MTLPAAEFMRRFLLHVLPGGFHRIRHYGLLANADRRENLTKARELLSVEAPVEVVQSEGEDPKPDTATSAFLCPDCGAPMVVIDTLLRAPRIRAPPIRQCAP